ncbi:MAG: metal-dependent hydrolase [Acidobacteria bacterium OLB17]|nr:MAG: metal-dependent hydrolase [Acidobacteria bacterium OLB17]MCZ2389775.1 putative metal-dependent hydrolase [Acidobacteriota bacterium]
MDNLLDDLRYPIGEFDANIELSPAARAERIEVLRRLPERVAEAVEGLSDEQLSTRYRPEGWTLRQTVHHLADSHANSYTRFKLALTEDEPPTIRPYFEDRWAELADSRMPVAVSLTMLSGIHARWVALLVSLSEADLQRAYIHPETGVWSIEKALALYAWHSLHHTAHITRTRERNGW